MVRFYVSHLGGVLLQPGPAEPVHAQGRRRGPQEGPHTEVYSTSGVSERPKDALRSTKPRMTHAFLLHKM